MSFPLPLVLLLLAAGSAAVEWCSLERFNDTFIVHQFCPYMLHEFRKGNEAVKTFEKVSEWIVSNRCEDRRQSSVSVSLMDSTILAFVWPPPSDAVEVSWATPNTTGSWITYSTTNVYVPLNCSPYLPENAEFWKTWKRTNEVKLGLCKGLPKKPYNYLDDMRLDEEKQKIFGISKNAIVVDGSHPDYLVYIEDFKADFSKDQEYLMKLKNDSNETPCKVGILQKHLDGDKSKVKFDNVEFKFVWPKKEGPPSLPTTAVDSFTTAQTAEAETTTGGPATTVESSNSTANTTGKEETRAVTQPATEGTTNAPRKGQSMLERIIFIILLVVFMSAGTAFLFMFVLTCRGMCFSKTKRRHVA
ncbi:hypothetical protein L596_009352 [Steinernema carpocapsae]|uniref:Uncharacterized protein n=1 Tax=Steinernema carpocapsae TaxID=34508 RepID=A0A4U5PFI5_STECR|nr:hypothetical protein L596_009352 [Steinernema carpocapsae]